MTDAALVTRRSWAGALVAVGVARDRGPRRPLREHQRTRAGSTSRSTGDCSATSAITSRRSCTSSPSPTRATSRSRASSSARCSSGADGGAWRCSQRLGPLVAVGTHRSRAEAAHQPQVSWRAVVSQRSHDRNRRGRVRGDHRRGRCQPTALATRSAVAGRGRLAVATAIVVAVALVAARYHYATDTVGGAAVAIASVIACALAIDEVADRIGRRRALRVRNDLPRHRRTR